MDFNYKFTKNYFFPFKSNIIFFSLFIIVISVSYSSIITIPFKIFQPKNNYSKNGKEIKDMSFYVKLVSFIEIGRPPQKIEAIFDLRLSNYYISTYCNDCSFCYSYNISSSFFRAHIDKSPMGFGNEFYAYETFYFYDEINKQKKTVEEMLIYLSESNDKKNCLIIGLKFPDNFNNKFQEPFIQQLKHQKIINKFCWTMIFNDNNELEDGYDGKFIFGDIINDVYSYNKYFSSDKIVSTYSGIKRKKALTKETALFWGISFDEINYVLPDKKENNVVNIDNNYISEFDFNLNTIYGTYEYSRNIQRDFFKFYFVKNICQLTNMRGSAFKYIYCHTGNFTQKDLEKFPQLNFINKDLRYKFTFDYKDLFYLTPDKKYYIFNIMMINLYLFDLGEDEMDGVKWILGLPFWRKYQFMFDSDNKLIYFFNKNGIFLDEEKYNKNDDNNYNKNTQTINNKDIINKNKTTDIDKRIENYYVIEVKKVILIIILIIVFLFIFCFLILIIRKLLFKKGFMLVRAKKVNELNEDQYYEYSSKSIDYIQDNNLKRKECEMQIQQNIGNI